MHDVRECYIFYKEVGIHMFTAVLLVSRFLSLCFMSLGLMVSTALVMLCAINLYTGFYDSTEAWNTLYVAYTQSALAVFFLGCKKVFEWMLGAIK